MNHNDDHNNNSKDNNICDDDDNNDDDHADLDNNICSSPHIDIVLAAIFLPIPSKFILLPPALTICASDLTISILSQ